MSESKPRSPLAGLAPAIDWLHSRGVSAPRLADLLHTTPENIRVIAFRQRRANPKETFLPGRLFNLDKQVAEQQRLLLPIRNEPYSGSDDVKTGRPLQWLEAEIAKCVSTHSKKYEFLRGAKALNGLLPYFAHASDVRRVRLLAGLHRHRAWFLVHTGRCASALRAALLALDLAQYCYRESRVYDRTDVQEVIEAAQIASNAALLSEQPLLALDVLEIVKTAYEKLDERRGSEYHRQAGTAYFQQGEPELARKHFGKAMVAMKERGEARNEAHLLMTGTRHLNLLPGFDWDHSQEIHRIAFEQFGPRSLERAINVNWTVACGMATDDPKIHKQAKELLDESGPVPSLFAHQNTVRTLLAITPELGLDEPKRYEWIRRTLYENSLRNR